MHFLIAKSAMISLTDNYNMKYENPYGAICDDPHYILRGRNMNAEKNKTGINVFKMWC